MSDRDANVLPGAQAMTPAEQIAALEALVKTTRPHTQSVKIDCALHSGKIYIWFLGKRWSAPTLAEAIEKMAKELEL